MLATILRSITGVMTSRILGFARDTAMAVLFGATALTDTFFLIFTIPNLLRGFITDGTLASVFIPNLTKLKTQDETGDSNKNNEYNEANKKHINSASIYTSAIIKLQTFITVIIVAIIVIIGYYKLEVFYPQLVISDTIDIAKNLIVILMPFLIFVSVSGTLIGYLNTYGSFYISYASNAVLNIAMIIGIVYGYYNNYSVYDISFGVLFGGVLQMLLLYWYSTKLGLKFDVMAKVTKDTVFSLLLIGPAIIIFGLGQLNAFISNIIASFIVEGAVSHIYYAYRLYQLPIGLFSVAIGAVALTQVSLAVAKNDENLRVNSTKNAVLFTLLLVLPCVLGLTMMHREIIALVYGHHNFNESHIESTALILQGYSFGLIFASLGNIFSKIYYAEKNFRLPVISALINFATTIGLSLYFMPMYAEVGIAYATSIALFINFAILTAGLFRSTIIKFVTERSFLIITLKIVLASLVEGVVIFYLKEFDLYTIIKIVIAMIVYLLMLLLTRLNPIKIIR